MQTFRLQVVRTEGANETLLYTGEVASADDAQAQCDEIARVLVLSYTTGEDVPAPGSLPGPRASGRVAFATPSPPDAARGDFVVRRGTFFQVGEYPDKQFALTEAEADAAIARFAPVPLNIEHIPTIFDGKLGMVRKLWREGRDLLAEYVIPRWLHEVTRGEAIKISSEWSRTTKCPQAGAFVLSGRVADAVMLPTFSTNAAQPRETDIMAFEVLPEELAADDADIVNGDDLFADIMAGFAELDAWAKNREGS